MATQRRTVTPCRHVPRARRGGGRTRLWAFSVHDLADLLGLSAWQVRKRVSDGRLDPSDIRAVATAFADLRDSVARRSS